MIPSVPAFGGVPGGPELLIILLILVLLFGVPIALIAGVVLFFRLQSDDEEADADRIAELEAEVERLREAVDNGRDEHDGDGDERL
jgi:sec-independent protein translocase protein TatA